jgi:hypothetical protein
MSIKLRRAVNAFIIGFLSGAAALLLSKEAEIADAITVGDVTALRFLIVPLFVGAIGFGIRAVQSNVPIVPSPEPTENAAKPLA